MKPNVSDLVKVNSYYRKYRKAITLVKSIEIREEYLRGSKT